MQLRKLLVAGAAVAAAGTLALVPAAQADTPTGDYVEYIGVGHSTEDIDYDAAFTLKAPASVTMPVAGVPTKLGCNAGTANAIVHAGAVPGTPYAAMNFTSLNLNCDSFIPGQVVTMNVPGNGCARFNVLGNQTPVDPDVPNSTYHKVHDSFPTGTVDSGPKDGKVSVVDGEFELPAGQTPECKVTVTAGICTIKVGGSTEAQFDEYVKDDEPITQSFYLKGDGLTVTDVAPLCFGAVAVNSKLTINGAINFNVVVTNETVSGDPATGPIDFRLTEQP